MPIWTASHLLPTARELRMNAWIKLEFLAGHQRTCHFREMYLQRFFHICFHGPVGLPLRNPEKVKDVFQRLLKFTNDREISCPANVSKATAPKSKRPRANTDLNLFHAWIDCGNGSPKSYFRRSGHLGVWRVEHCFRGRRCHALKNTIERNGRSCLHQCKHHCNCTPKRLSSPQTGCFWNRNIANFWPCTIILRIEKNYHYRLHRAPKNEKLVKEETSSTWIEALRHLERCLQTTSFLGLYPARHAETPGAASGIAVLRIDL